MAVSRFLGGQDDGEGSKVGGQCLTGHGKSYGEVTSEANTSQ